MALDVYFDGKDATYPAGYYRGVIDTATAPSKTGIQKLAIDFPDDRTNATVKLKRAQVYEPGAEPVQPGKADGEVARAVPVGALPDVDVPTTPFGLTAAQQRVIKELYYDGFAYAGRDRMWALLQDRARAEGQLAERTLKRRDGTEVTVATPFGIRQKQLAAYLNSLEHRQVHKRPTRVKNTRSFVLPVAPVRRCMMDTMNLGKDGGGRSAMQKWVIGAIDPSSKWAHAEIFQGNAPTQAQSMQVLVNALKRLRDGPAKHDAGNAAQVFTSDGALEHTLVLATDQGSEFGSNKPAYGEALRQRLLDEGLIQSGDKFIHRYNLASAPTQAAHIERLWSTLRTKLKLAATAQFNGIDRKVALEARRETYSRADEAAGRGVYGQSKGADGWTSWVRRAVDAVNRERAAGTDLSPVAYIETYVREGKAAVARATADGNDAELDRKGERELRRQDEVKVGSLARKKDLAKGKAELKGFLKMRPNWSTELFRVTKVTKRKSSGLGNASFLYQLARTNGDPVQGSFRHEELQLISAMKDTWTGGPSRGREYIDRLRAEKVIPGWDERHNRPLRDGDTWAEREIDKLPETSYNGLRREQVLRHPVQYVKQGASKESALQRLEDSLRPDGGPADITRLAILTKDD